MGVQWFKVESAVSRLRVIMVRGHVFYIWDSGMQVTGCRLLEDVFA